MIDVSPFSDKIRFCLVGVIVILVFLLVLSSQSDQAGGEEIVVDEAGGGDYSTIQEAVINAGAGDIIRVKNGGYIIDDLAGNLKIGTTIIGEDRDDTRLVFPSSVAHFFVYMSDIHLENLNFTSENSGRPNFIKLFGADTTIVNCSFTNVDIQFEMGRANGFTFTGNALWNSRFSFQGPVNHYGSPENTRESILRSHIQDMVHYRLENNSFNGLPLHYLLNSNNVTIPSGDGGLILIDCHDITLDNLHFPTTSNGLILMGCSNISINSTSILSATNLLSVWLSTNVSIRDSTIGDPDHTLPPSPPLSPSTSSTLISLYSNGLELLNNTIHTDIQLEGGQGPVITGNGFLNFSGLTLSSVTNAEVTGNSFQELGITLRDDTAVRADRFFRHAITGNDVGGRSIEYRLDQKDLAIPQDAGQVILVNCSTMSMDSLNLSSVSRGLFLYMTSDSSIAACSFNGNSVDVLLQFSHRNTLVGSTFRDSGSLGLSILDGDRNTISNCSFENSFLSLSGELNAVNSCHVSLDRTDGNHEGILSNGNSSVSYTRVQGFRYGLHHVSGYLTVLYSNITNNQQGIYLERDTSLRVDASDILQNSGNGITVRDPDQMTVIDSRISDNGNHGMELDGFNSILSDCDIMNNGNSGVVVSGSNGVLMNNRIENNTNAGIEASMASYLRVLNNTIRHNAEGISSEGCIEYLIANCSILSNDQDGIKTTGGSYGVIENTSILGSIDGINLIYTTADIQWCTITSNTNGIYAFRPVTTVNVTNCIIMANSEFGISTPEFNAFRVIAHSNYWGSPSGPFNSESNPLGHGDSIGTEIEFSPWFQDVLFTKTERLDEGREDGEAEDVDRTVTIVIVLILAVPFIMGIVRFRRRTVPPGAHREPKVPFVKDHGAKDIVLPAGLRYATVTTRTVAAMIDGLAIIFFLILIFLVLIMETESGETFCGLMLGVYILIPIEYFLFIEGYSGQSLGKGMSRVKLYSLNNGPITFGQAIRSGVVKGFLYPFCYIVDAVLGIFVVHKGSQQRLSQHHADLVVVAMRRKKVRSSGAKPSWDQMKDGTLSSGVGGAPVGGGEDGCEIDDHGEPVMDPGGAAHPDNDTKDDRSG